MRNITIPVQIPADHPALVALENIEAPNETTRRRVQKRVLGRMIEVLLDDVGDGGSRPYADVALRRLIGGRSAFEFAFGCANHEEVLQAKALYELTKCLEGGLELRPDGTVDFVEGELGRPGADDDMGSIEVDREEGRLP